MVERDGKSKGYGFVTFTTPSDAESFVSNKGEPHVIDGKQADAKKSVPKQEHIHRTNMLAAAEAATKVRHWRSGADSLCSCASLSPTPSHATVVDNTC